MSLSAAAKYLHLTKVSFLRASFYRFELLFDSLKAIVMVVVFAAIWKEIYRERIMVGGFTLSQIVLYTCSAVTFSLVFEVDLERYIGYKVRTGSFSLEFIKPVNYFLYCLFDNLGTVIYTALFCAVPTAAALVFLFDLSPVSQAGPVQVLVLSSLGFFLFYLACHISALTTFLTEDVWGIVYMRTMLLRFFAGGFIPLSLFPDALAGVNDLLPFKYMIYAPVSVLCGKALDRPFSDTVALQLGWLVVLFALDQLFWRSVVVRVTVHGG